MGASIEEIKKKKELENNRSVQISTKINKVENGKELSVLDKFLLELGDLNEKQSSAFEEIKSIRLEKCLLEEYEAFAIDEANLDQHSAIITYLINDKIRFEEDGVVVKLRTPIFNRDNLEITKEVKVLFESNNSREREFLKLVKTKANDANRQSDESDALISASIENVQSEDGRVQIISPQLYRKIKTKDTEIIGRCYNFFRL